MSASTSQYVTTNFMVPAGGNTHAVGFLGTFGAPFPIDWRQFTIDAFPFQPQGVYIDNTLGTVALVVTILPINWNITCPAGQSLARSFPAPNGQTASIVGDGVNNANVIFVDYPVFNT